MHPLVCLAKLAVESYMKEKKNISPPEDLPEEFLTRRAGVFVTIEKELKGLPRSRAKLVLRGCIGTYLPTRINIAEEIIRNAVAAATEDWRFEPIREEELPQLSYTVYILGEPELVKNLKKLDPKKYGVIVKTVPIVFPNMEVVFKSHVVSKTGLLLPDLKGIDTAKKQISIACQKAGIDPQNEKILIYRFATKKYQ